MKTPREILLETISPNCHWEEMDNLTNTDVGEVLKAMEIYAAQFSEGGEKSHSVLNSIIGRYCQKLDKYSEENQMKYQSKTNDQERSITAGMILATKKIANELRELINDR